MGIVMASVNVAHGELFSAFTTTSATHGQQNNHDRQHGQLGDQAAAFC